MEKKKPCTCDRHPAMKECEAKEHRCICHPKSKYIHKRCRAREHRL